MVCHFVAFCIGRISGRWERRVVSEFRVEADEQVVVVQAGESAREGNRGWEVGYVVKGRGGGECWVVLEVRCIEDVKGARPTKHGDRRWSRC